MNRNVTFGMRGWRTGSPHESGYYIIKAIKRSALTAPGDFNESLFEFNSACVIVIKSYFTAHNQEFNNIPEGFVFNEWLDQTPVFLLCEDEISDEFGEEWYVNKRNPFRKDKFLKLLNSCSIEQAEQDRKRRIEQSEKYRSEQDGRKESHKKFKTPPNDESEW